MRKTMTQSNTEQLRFPAINGLTVRADFNGGVLSTDLGPLILGGVDRQIQVAHQMTKAFNDQRHPSYIDQLPIHSGIRNCLRTAPSNLINL